MDDPARQLRQDLKSRDLTIAHLRSDLLSYQSLKEQHGILEKQFKLLRNKLSYYETALAERTQ